MEPMRRRHGGRRAVAASTGCSAALGDPSQPRRRAGTHAGDFATWAVARADAIRSPGLILPTAWALVRPLTHAGSALDAERTSPGCGRPPGAGQAAELLRGGGRLASRRDLARPEPAANRQCL